MDIYSILSSKPHNPHYLNRYITFIEQCQQKNVGYEGYVERHHICPRAKDMFPEYEDFRLHPWNLAVLTARQHFIAHIILWKCFSYYGSCIQTLWLMSNGKWKQYRNYSKRYEKLRNEYVETCSNVVTVKDPKDPDRGYFRVSVNDPDYLSGKYVSYMKGLVLVNDIKNPEKESFFVSLDDHRYVSGEYIAVAQKGYTVAKDPNDSSKGYFKIATNDSDYLSGKYVSYMKGTVSVKDPKNPDKGIFHVSVDDPRYISGEFEHAMKGRVSVKDPENPERGCFQVPIDHPDYVSGKYIPIAAGKVSVKDLENPERGYFQVPVDHPDYVSGRYVPFRLGQKRTEKNLVFAIDSNGNKIKVPSDDKRLGDDLRRLSTPDVLYLLESGEKKWLPRFNNYNVKYIIFENKDYFKRRNSGKYDFYTPWGLFGSHKEALNHMPSGYNFTKIEIYNFCVNSTRTVKERHLHFFGSFRDSASLGTSFADHGFFVKPKFVIPRF